MRKGDKAYWVTMSADFQTFHVVAEIRPVRIESWGKKQGTCYRLDRLGMAKCLFPTAPHFGHQQIFESVEAATAYIGEKALAYSAQRIAGTLECYRATQSILRPEYQARGLAEIARLESLRPSFEIRVIPEAAETAAQ